MFRRSLNICLCGLALSNCGGHIHLEDEVVLGDHHIHLDNKMIVGEIVSPSKTISIRSSDDVRSISSTLNIDEDREASLTLVVMDASCIADYNDWLTNNETRFESSDMVRGAIIHKINHGSGDEFVIVIDEDYLPTWRVDIEKFSFDRSKAIIFGTRSYRFKRMLMPLFKHRRVIVPKEGCNLRCEYIARNEGWADN
jgi:hypothetical protein